MERAKRALGVALAVVVLAGAILCILNFAFHQSQAAGQTVAKAEGGRHGLHLS
ncbi:MAG: hypothetical protein V3R63_05620 [Alphaproteobacteria bacterium]